MKHLLFILVFVSVANGSFIGDFAPLKVGSVWKYSYTYYQEYMGWFTRCDTLSIEINLQSIQIRDKDTLVLLDVKEQGRSISAYNGDGVISHDTTGSTRFIDTVIMAGDSIFKSSKYRCKAFPFWKVHNVDSINLNKGLSGIDTLYYPPSPNFRPENGYTYLQNIGLYSYNYSYGGHLYENIHIKLASFNDNLNTKHPGKYSQMFNITNPNSSRLLTFTHNKLAQSAFSLTGKKVYIGDNLPTGIIITKGSEPVK